MANRGHSLLQRIEARRARATRNYISAYKYRNTTCGRLGARYAEKARALDTGR